MALTINEDLESRAWVVGESATFVYNLDESNEASYPSSESAIQALVEATAPTLFQGLRRKNDFNIARNGRANLSKVTVNYKKSDDPTEMKVAFEIGGGSATVKHAIQTLRSYSSDNRKARGLQGQPDFQGLIGVSNNSVAGVDVPVPSFNFTLTRFVPNGFLNSFVNDMNRLHAKVNSQFVNFSAQGWTPVFEAGELLFRGGTGAPREEEGDWEIQLKFSAETNEKHFQLEGFTAEPDIVKDGWDYVWETHVDSEDENAFHLVRVPDSAYVERVIKRVSMSRLFR